MEKEFKIYRNEEKKDYFCIIPVERNSVTLFSVKNNEIKALGNNEIFVNKDAVSKYLMYFFDKYFDSELMENKIKMGNKDYKGTSIFEWEGKDNFYTLDYIKLMKEELEEITFLLKNDYDNCKLEDYKTEVLTINDTCENKFKTEINKITDFYTEICNYFEELLQLDEDKYIISIIKH